MKSDKERFKRTLWVRCACFVAWLISIDSFKLETDWIKKIIDSEILKYFFINLSTPSPFYLPNYLASFSFIDPISLQAELARPPPNYCITSLTSTSFIDPKMQKLGVIIEEVKTLKSNTKRKYSSLLEVLTNADSFFLFLHLLSLLPNAFPNTMTPPPHTSSNSLRT